MEFCDADFHELDVENPIVVQVTLGALPEHLMDLDSYGEVLRAFSEEKQVIEDEPREGLEVVLTLELRVTADLETKRTLYSERTFSETYQKQLLWKDRALFAPSRIGSHSHANLSWTRNSVLTKLSETKLAVGTDLVTAARDARKAFGNRAGNQLTEVLELVTKKAVELGVDIGETAQALLDANALSFSDGAICLHAENGVPLRTLGTGSTRLILASLHREASTTASTLLVDEVEHGLEPHRLIRLLHSLGSKDEKTPPLQVFMTTHSPVVVRELSGDQLVIVRRETRGKHTTKIVGTDDAIQGVARTYPEAFLARTIVVCEGASEVGLLRGVDRYYASQGKPSAYASATAFVDAGGRSPEHILRKAGVFAKWGYSTLAFLDSDVAIDDWDVDIAEAEGVEVHTWEGKLALEEALFTLLPDCAIDALITLAIELNSEDLVAGALEAVSSGTLTLAYVLSLVGGDAAYSDDERAILGKAAKLTTKDTKTAPGRKGWFKSITKMERVGADVLGPNLADSDVKLKDVMQALFAHAHG
ncbi:putative AbiEii toxin of type IV toxin-antitoxin system [Janthinobacterium sp. 64]|nr:putative AbiEii toxin of type IV toxin-antitoxin system [Janthinobacterium sp. 64]